MTERAVPFVVYDTRTGEILRYGITTPQQVDLQASGAFEAVLQAQGNDLTHRVVDGELVEIEPEQQP